LTTAAVSEVPPSRVQEDLPCGTCGYNLRTLEWSGSCSECGRPVRESRLLPGFRFSGLRAARRLQLVLALLVAATLVEVAAEIWFTYTCYTWLQTVNRAWRQASLYAWAYSSSMVAVIHFVVIWLLLRLFRSPTGKATSRLPRLALGFGTADLAFHLILTVLSRPFFSVNVAPSFAQVVSMLQAAQVLCAVSATILVWICLLRLTDRDAGRCWWLAPGVIVGLLLVALSSQFVYLVIFLGDALSGSYTGSSTAYISWYDVQEACRRYAVRPSAIFLMVIVSLYLRRLDAAIRLTRCVLVDRGG
jgi:hypothetical protein